MANLYIAELQKLEKDAKGNIVPIARMPPITEQKIAYTSVQLSAAFHDKTKFIRVIADAVAHLEFGGAPVATEANSFIPSGVPEYFSVIAGQKVSVYDGSS